MSGETPRVLITGSVGLDSISTPFGKREMVPGGSAVYASLACAYFAPAAVVGVAGEDFPKKYLDMLRGRGVDTAGLKISPGRTFHWEGRYDYDFNTAHTLKTDLNVMGSFTPEVPEDHIPAEYLFLANIDPEIQLEVARAAGAPRITAADTMNFWIDNKKDKLLEVLELTDILMLNDSEARQLSGSPNLTRACRSIMKMGPGTVIVKQGEYGATMFYSDSSGEKVETFSAPSFPLETVRDPTGAGDSFAGAFMGYLARNEIADERAIRTAVALGSVVASFTVEGFSTEALEKAGPDGITGRFNKLREMALFESLKE